MRGSMKNMVQSKAEAFAQVVPRLTTDASATSGKVVSTISRKD